MKQQRKQKKKVEAEDGMLYALVARSNAAVWRLNASSRWHAKLPVQSTTGNSSGGSV